MSIQEEEDQDFDLDALSSMMDMRPPGTDTPEGDFFYELTSGKYHKLYNCLFWLKQELSVYRTLKEKSYILYKPDKDKRIQVPTKEITKGLLEHYFLMMYFVKFNNDRGQTLDMGKFLDLVLDYPPIKELMANPDALI